MRIANAMHLRMALLHSLCMAAGWYAWPVFGPRPRVSEKRSKNLTVRLSEEEYAEVQRLAKVLSERTGSRYSAGDLIREGLRTLQEQLEVEKIKPHRS